MMVVGLLAFFYLLQLAVVYRAACWDYAPLVGRFSTPRGMQWLVTMAGTLYLPLVLIMAQLATWGELAVDIRVPEMAFVGLVLLLLAWPPLRASLLQRLRLDPQRALHGLLLYFVLGVLLQFATFYLPYVMEGAPFPVMDSAMLLKSLLGKLLLIALALVAAGLGSKRSWRPVVERLQLQRRLGFSGLGIALFVLAVTVFSMQVVPGLVSSLLAKFSLVAEPLYSGVSSDAGWFRILLSTIGAGLAEELFFRGLLQPRIGIFWASLLFTMGHIQYPISSLVAIFLSALLWGWLAKRYGLRASLLVHILNNSFLYAIALLPPFMKVIYLAAPRAICAAGFLWLVGYGIYRFAGRQKTPFSPETRPWLAGVVSLVLFGGALGVTLLMLPLGISSGDPGAIAWAIGLGLLVFLASLPPIRRRLMCRFHLNPGRWAHLFAFYALAFWAVKGLLDLCTRQPQSPWMFHGFLGLFGEALSFSLFLSGIALLGVGAGLWRTTRRQVFERLGFDRKRSWATWCLAPAFAALFLLVGYVLCWLYEPLALLSGMEVPSFLHIDPVHIAVLAPVLLPLCMHACTEELLFRGALQPRVGLATTSWVAALSGIGFLLRFYGLSSVLLPLLLYVLASVGLGWIARRYGLGLSMLTSCLLYAGVFFACFL